MKGGKDDDLMFIVRLELYVEAASRAGFKVIETREPMPSEVIEKKYP